VWGSGGGGYGVRSAGVIARTPPAEREKMGMRGAYISGWSGAEGVERGK